MKKLFYLILALAFCVSCESGGDDAKTFKDANLATIEEQMSAISQSLPKIKAAVSALKDVVEGAEPSASAVTRGNNDEDKIHGIKEYIAALEERIAALENYIAEGGEYSDWLETTFATLAMYEETISILATVQAEVESLKEQMSASNKALLDKADSKIEAAIGSMKDWVCDKLSGYYDIAATDALLAQLEATISDSDTELRAEIESLRNGLRESLAEMKSDYEDAIAKAINDNNGVLTSLLQKEINKVNNRIDDEIDTLNKRLDDIEKRLEELEKVVADLIKRIQSITYLPIYEDDAARVECYEVGTAGSRLQLDFMISPKDGVADLAKAYKNVIGVDAFYAGSSEFIDLPVISCSAKPEQGILTVVVAGDNLGEDFFYRKKNYNAVMSIDDGNNDLKSDKVHIIPADHSGVAGNQIKYSTTNNQMLSFDNINIFGTKIVSHEYNAFDNIGYIIFEDDVKCINKDVFSNNTYIQSIALGDSVISIEDNAFVECTSLESITIPNSVTTIGEHAFYHCFSLTSVYINDIASWCGILLSDYCSTPLSYAHNLYLNGELVTDLVIPDSVTTIGNYAFDGCSSLTSITIPDSVTTIGVYAFSGCSSLTSITIPNSVTTIGDWAFSSCSSLKSITIPDSVTTIGDSTFYGCKSLASITIPDSVTTIGEDAFNDCISLTSITIPDSVTTIGKNAFRGCSSLKSITIPDSVTDIGEYAFIGCSSLKSITIPDSVTDIGEYAFMSCSSLTSVTIGNSVTEIGDWAFQYCSSLTSITFGSSVKSIRSGAFHECNSLKKVNYKGSLSDWCKIDFANPFYNEAYVISNPLSWGAKLYIDGKHLKSIIIPSDITRIKPFAFFGYGDDAPWYDINAGYSLIIHEGVTEIGDYAFYGCQLTNGVICKPTVPPVAGKYIFSIENDNRPSSIIVPIESVDAYEAADGWKWYGVQGYDFE